MSPWTRLKQALAAVVIGFATVGALAQDVAPDALVQGVSQDVIAIVKQDRDIQRGNTKKILELVEAKVLPHFDFQRMTQLAMGASWRRATPEQQKQLTEEFRTLLVRTYSAGLANYRDQVIEYKPLRAKPEETEVIVRSEVKQSGAQPVPIDYNMQKTAGGWKVYDVAIGGVSLVTTYRDTFTQEVRANGVDGLIKTLADKNRQLASRQS